jgi:hypothetical protein
MNSARPTHRGTHGSILPESTNDASRCPGTDEAVPDAVHGQNMDDTTRQHDTPAPMRMYRVRRTVRGASDTSTRFDNAHRSPGRRSGGTRVIAKRQCSHRVAGVRNIVVLFHR